jgi:hypothetical protein
VKWPIVFSSEVASGSRQENASIKHPDQSGLVSELVFSPRDERLTRASTRRSSIWTIMPGCFLITGVATTGAPGAGGDIFSNEKAGMVHPLVVELRHSPASSGITQKRLAVQIVLLCLTQTQRLEHNLCQIAAILAAL